MEPPWKAYDIMRKMDYPYEVSPLSNYLILDDVSSFICDKYVIEFVDF